MQTYAILCLCLVNFVFESNAKTIPLNMQAPIVADFRMTNLKEYIDSKISKELKKASETESKVEKLENTISSLRTKFKNMSEIQDTLLKQMYGINDTASKSESKVEKLEDTLSSLRTKFRNMPDLQDNLSKQIDDIQDTASKSESKVEKLEDTLSSLRTKFRNMPDLQDNLSKQIDDIQDTASKSESKVEKLEDTLSSLRTKFRNMPDLQDNLSKQIDDIQDTDTVKKLTDEIKQIKKLQEENIKNITKIFNNVDNARNGLKDVIGQTFYLMFSPNIHSAELLLASTRNGESSLNRLGTSIGGKITLQDKSTIKKINHSARQHFKLLCNNQ